MNRGIFGSLAEQSAYIQAKKDWHIELSQTHIYWYDLLIDPPATLDTRKFVVEQLKSLRENVESTLEKRFIYFICSRTKVRFNTRRQPHYDATEGMLHLHLLVGREKKHLTVCTILLDPETETPVFPEVEVSEKFITVTDHKGNSTVMNVHDFLIQGGINIGQPSLVQYVGYTKNPDTRPTNGSHTGLTDILYKVSNEDNDIFIIFNLFKVMANAISAPYGINFIVPNSMTDEINADLEGLLIEKCFLTYFDSSNQTRNKDNERAELEKNLGKIANENNINSIDVDYEVDDDSEYWQLGSSTIDPKKKHTFTVRIENGSLTTTVVSS